MAIAYTWEVTGIKVTTLNNTPNVVVQTYWKKIGTDEEGNQGTFSGATPFSLNSMPEGSTFIPFDELTEADVLEWIKAVVVASYEQHVNDQINKQISEKKNPVVEVTLPWAPANTVSNTVNVSNTDNSNSYNIGE